MPLGWRTLDAITVDAAGKMTAETTDFEQAPAPRKLSRLMLPGAFAATALALAVGGACRLRRGGPVTAGRPRPLPQ